MKINTILLILFFLSLLGSAGIYLYQKNNVSPIAQGCVPINFRKEMVEEKMYLKWETNDECSGYVKYGLKDNSLPYLAVDQNENSKSKSHSALISGVDSGVEIFVIIHSGEGVYGNEGLPIKVKVD